MTLLASQTFETGKLLARLGGQAARVVHGNDNGNLRIVIDADLKVLNTMAGSGVDAARAAFQRDVVTQNDQTLAVKERMLILHELEAHCREQSRAGPRTHRYAAFDRDSTSSRAMMW